MHFVLLCGVSWASVVCKFATLCRLKFFKCALCTGVEHLLRDVKDATVSTLATDVGRMVTGLRGLKSRIEEIMAYMKLVCQGAIPVNHDILYQLQVLCHTVFSMFSVPSCEGSSG